MSVPKPPFHSASEELLYNIYLKLQDMNSLQESDINTLAKLNAILTDADLMKVEDITLAMAAGPRRAIDVRSVVSAHADWFCCQQYLACSSG